MLLRFGIDGPGFGFRGFVGLGVWALASCVVEDTRMQRLR